METLKKELTSDDAREVLRKFRGVVLFPEKVAKAKEMMKISGLPIFPLNQKISKYDMTY